MTPETTPASDPPLPRSLPAIPPGIGRVLIVIPAFNEGGRVGRVVRDVRRTLPGADVLVVDDGSSDETGKESRAYGAAVLTLPMNLGYGAALQTGYKYAVRRGYEVIGQIDGDGQHQAQYFPEMLAELADPGVDVVIGSRFLDRDGHYTAPRARKVGMAIFGSLASVLTRQHISDPTSGFQVLRAPVAHFFCTDVYPTDYPDADILIALNRSGFSVREVPVQMRPSAGASMHRGHHSFYYVYKMLLSIFVTVLRPRSKDTP